jgi:hypothetical protein
MKTPTLEEVKDYFKNAKEVRCLAFNNIINIENANITESERVFKSWNGSKFARLYDKDFYKYAEIISYKESDSIVESVINQFKERSEVGIKKYGTTLDRNDLTTLEWIKEAQQEAMDFCLYLEKLKQEYMK